MERKENLWDKELWSQQEVASHFRVSTNTIKNWRRRGLLSYWQAHGSPRKLYFRDEILNFLNNNSVVRGGGKAPVGKTNNKEKPVISLKFKDDDWRI